jgi:hypothetical protein
MVEVFSSWVVVFGRKLTRNPSGARFSASLAIIKARLSVMNILMIG